MNVQRRRASILLIAACAMLSIGCGLSESELPGTYELRYSYGVERITMSSDGSYQQVFQSNKGDGFDNRDHWQLRSTNRVSTLILKGAVIVDDGFGNMAPQRNQGDWLMPVRRGLFGGIYLVSNEDLGFEFEKIENDH